MIASDRNVRVGVPNGDKQTFVLGSCRRQVDCRGATVRSPHDGGEQERSLAKRYRRDAEALRFDWPRRAAILDRIAESYAGDAEREDQSADQRDWQ
jgi:hypothetical protein